MRSSQRPRAPSIRLSDMTLYITPSSISPWREVLRKGEKFTGHQRRVMRELGLDPETVETMEVLSVATARERWWPEHLQAPFVEITCPVLQRLPDERVKVISPIGTVETVLPNGRVGQSRFGWKRGAE